MSRELDVVTLTGAEHDELLDEIERLRERGDSAHALVADQMRTISSQLDEIERLRGLLVRAKYRLQDNLAGKQIAADIDAALSGADQPPAYHVDPTGTTREPPHCPTCACGATAQPSEPCFHDFDNGGTCKLCGWPFERASSPTPAQPSTARCPDCEHMEKYLAQFDLVPRAADPTVDAT